MHCKFLNHGIALAYQNIVRPCCTWEFDSEYQNTNRAEYVDFFNWHNQNVFKEARETLAAGKWPKNCNYCKTIESQGRHDSTRLNGNRSYEHFTKSDLVVEIRPGSVCNFACQTCSPAASSRVYQYYKSADMLSTSETADKKVIRIVDHHKSESFANFDFLLPVANQIKTVILLGGEPFYDKNCIKFLHWWEANTNAELITFTNGSVINYEFLQKSKNKIILVFSLDAIEKESAYIRFGTDWSVVENNFRYAKQLSNIEVRVNITTSVYNFYYLDRLIDYLLDDWPSVVSFGPATEDLYQEQVIPIEYRQVIIDKLTATIEKLKVSSVEEGQKWNAINAIVSIVENLKLMPFDSSANQKLQKFINQMDSVKKISISDYCPELVNYFN